MITSCPEDCQISFINCSDSASGGLACHILINILIHKVKKEVWNNNECDKCLLEHAHIVILEQHQASGVINTLYKKDLKYQFICVAPCHINSDCHIP